MTRVSYRPWLRAVPLLLTLDSCSALYDLDATQCQVTADCAALGSAFEHMRCEDRVCVPDDVTSAGSGAGSVSQSGAGGEAPVEGEAGAANEGGSGTAGAPSMPECTTNEECIKAHLEQPYVCRDNTCIPLTNAECPVLLPSSDTLQLLETADPIVIGGFASMGNLQDPHDSLAVINWDLAFSEFNHSTLGGLPSKQGGEPRPVLALICQGTSADLTPSLTHLTQELRVPSILSTLATDKLFTAFNFTQSPAYAAAQGRPVLFLSTGSADLRLANLADDGLVWHMLGDPRSLAATANAMLAKMIPTVNAARIQAGEDPEKTPLRVTLVYSDDTTMTDLFSVLTTPDDKHPETLLEFNGQSAISQLAGVGSGDFREVKIESIKNHSNPNVSAAITDLRQNPPHIVLALATAEFAKTVIPALENGWGTGTSPKSSGLARPFYLASHFLYNTVELRTVVDQFSGFQPPLNLRLAGVNYAEAQDDHSKQLYASYSGRLANSYQGSLPLGGTENYYDGAYAMLYSLAAAYAARTDPSGAEVRDGLQDRVFSTADSAVSVDVGPAAVGNSVASLSGLAFKMSLWGTMGPPSFDRTSGTRLSLTSAWCLQSVASAWTYQADGLLFDATQQKFNAPASGVPACLQQY